MIRFFYYDFFKCVKITLLVDLTFVVLKKNNNVYLKYYLPHAVEYEMGILLILNMRYIICIHILKKNQTHSWAIQSWGDQNLEATTPELGPVRFWSPKSRVFSGSDSIVVEEAAKNFLSPRPSVNKSGALNFFIQHDKVEDSKLRRYLETFGRALEQFLQRRTSYYLLTRHAARPTGKASNIIT